jgi:hypothetical protein
VGEVKMKKLCFLLLMLLVLIATGSLQPVILPLQQSFGAAIGTGPSCSLDPPSGCTVFTVSQGDRVFFGGNDDYINPDSYYWVDLGGAQGYGAIWIGTSDNVQQGVNEMGLAYDANGLPRVDTNPHPERKPVSGSYSSYPIQILRECATVAEVIEWVNTHQWHSYMHDQMQFADASGDAVIISAGPDGELVFTRKPSGDGFLVSTNFNVADPSNGYGYPCWRYETAQRLLGQRVSQEHELTASDAASVLEAVHVEGGASWTIESLVADLPKGVVYLYYFYQFDQPVVLNVAEEIANPRNPGPLSKLFSYEVQQEAARRYQRIRAQAGGCQWLGITWFGLIFASLIPLLISSRNENQLRVFWTLVVIILGPLGLLVWLVARRKLGASAWRAALVETAGDVMPTVIAFMAMLVVFITIPAAGAAEPVQLSLVLGLPLLVGWLVFQGPLLASATQEGYSHTLGQRLPQAWVVANLGMAGITAVALPLASLSTRICSFFPLPLWTVTALWAVVALGALVGGLLLLIFERWAVRRGFRAWSVLASAEGEVVSPPWRNLWWWILLSYVALFGGIVVNAFVGQLLSA